MRNRNKIIKPKFYHKLLYKTCSEMELLRYSITCLISGFIFSIVSEKADFSAIKVTIGTFGCLAYALSYYLFPYIEHKSKEKFATIFIKYMFLLLSTFICTIFWISFCMTGVFENGFLVILIPISSLEMILLILLINYTLKPIISIVHTISINIKKKASENNESKITAYIKSTFAGLSVIASFILSALAILTTIGAFLKPLLKK